MALVVGFAQVVADHGLEGGLVGDVTDAFAPSEPLRFMPAVDAG